MANFLNKIILWITEFIFPMPKPLIVNESKNDMQVIVNKPMEINIDTLTTWDTPENCRHNVRVLADLEGLTVGQKNLMSQVIHCESGYNTKATHPNLVNGKVTSEDFGICQWNNKYHGSEITPDEAMNDPEKAVRLMCKYVKEGLIKQWVCFSSGLYEKYPS